MKIPVKHTVTTTETLQVEVDPISVLDKMHWEAQKNKPKDAEYIRDGYWYVKDFYDYHKRVDVESKGRKATTEELELWEAYILLKYRYRNKERD